jgi:hypothetical protein
MRMFTLKAHMSMGFMGNASEMKFLPISWLTSNFQNVEYLYLSDDSRTDILWHNIPTIFHMFLTIYYDLYNPLS